MLLGSRLGYRRPAAVTPALVRMAVQWSMWLFCSRKPHQSSLCCAMLIYVHFHVDCLQADAPDVWRQLQQMVPTGTG
jgi:hypothetical protein